MSAYTVMAYNVRWMNNLFSGGEVKPSQRDRARAIADVIQRVDPDVLAISEAANSAEEHRHFIDNYLGSGSGYSVAMGVSRGAQNLAFYHRPPFNSVSIDDEFDYYDPWLDDVDTDNVTERFYWERKPLEVVFEVGSGGSRLRMILVHTKSKGVFSVVDLHDYQKIALANRKRLAAQASRLRERLDDLVTAPESTPTIVLGDMNDGPGLDPYERTLGRSFVETVVGNVFEPEGIFHDSLWWMTKSSSDRRELWTADFPDPIVSHFMKFNHRVWIDHIVLSPDMLLATSPIRYVYDSGRIDERDATARDASDHRAVYCRIEA